MRILKFFLLIGLSCSLVRAQHNDSAKFEELNEPYFRISMALAYTFLPQETHHGRENLILPTIALDLEYWLSHKWGVGLHNDLELMIFEVKDEGSLFIEREYPVLLTLDLLFRPYAELVIFAGPGVELEPLENYFVFRIGVEYEIPFSKHWDVAPMIFYDAREGAYNTLTLGLGMGYRL